MSSNLLDQGRVTAIGVDMARGTLNTPRTALTSETFAQCWTLDSTGNWQGFREDDTGDGTWDLIQARTANPVNEITGISETVGPSWVTPAYSPAGNMTTIPQPNDPTQSYAATYDAWNQLVQIADGSDTVSEYAYDGARRRILQKSYTGGTLSETRHLYYTQPNQWQILEEQLDTSADPDRQFVWGLRYIDDCVLRDRDTTNDGTLDERLYALQDANWNVTAVTDTGGDVQERYAYSAYGVSLSLTPTFGNRAASSFDWESLYCGYRYETATGLFHVRNRVYLVTLGSWIQRDPIGYPNGLNSYAYHASISGIDPYGLATLCENHVLRAQLSEDWIPGGVGSTREGRISNRCNVNIYCADSCRKNGAGDELGGLTFVEGGHIHICMRNIDLPDDLPLSEIADYQRRFDALILHEMSHAADLFRDPRFHCPQPDWDKPNPPPRDLKPPPFPDPRLCNDCKAAERRAYTAQARYICPDDRAFQRGFVNAGICFSCRHVCPEFQARPCPQFPDDCGG
jgi:RHS repeat-associated protein